MEEHSCFEQIPMTKAEETATLLCTSFEVGDHVWWAGKGRYNGMAGIVVAIRGGLVDVNWSSGQSGTFHRDGWLTRSTILRADPREK